MCSPTWPAVLCALLVDHLFDSSSKQHPWGVMVKSLEGFTGAVGLLSGYAAGSLLSISWRGGVSGLLIDVSLAVYFSVSLALGQRAERPLLPHPFHSACMLGIQLPPLYPERSLKALSRLDYFTLFFFSLSLLLWFSSFPLPNTEARSVTPSGQSVLHSLHLEDETQMQKTIILQLHLQNNTDGIYSYALLFILGNLTEE